MAGWGNRDAVAVGLQRSGPVISWAGLIMAVAYSGFLFSEIPLLNQIGFFIVLVRTPRHGCRAPPACADQRAIVHRRRCSLTASSCARCWCRR